MSTYRRRFPGKTLLADDVNNAVLRRLARVQGTGGVVALVDCTAKQGEVVGGVWPASSQRILERARNAGVRVEEMLLSAPDYPQQGIEIEETLRRSGAVDLVALVGCKVRRR